MKRLFSYLLVFTLLMSTLIPVVNANEDVSKSQNKYIKQYFKEKETKKSEKKTDLVDPVVEEKIILETLTYYYKEDLKVANILSQFYNDMDLIDKVTSLIKEDKIDIMHKIIEIYPSIEFKNDKKIMYAYFLRYAKNTDDKTSIQFLDENNEQVEQNSFTILASYYNGTAAGDWAYNNYNNYNKYSTNYPAFTGGWGSDCTNFVSQAMHVGGGKAMEGTWYIYKKNSTYLVPTSAAELDYSWTLADPSPWISVDTFLSYWRPKSTVHSMSHDYYVANHKTVYTRSIYKGDVVIFSKGVANFITVPTHAMIISAYDTVNSDFKLAGHSNERRDYPLLSAISDYSHIDIIEIP
ncbi:amidase domain-containing protein [Tepidibacillus infernus]|uniref:amidase domain-containing protein n=1 Tax=Tepidibacillus infernus TaxID=1806172 RepID=UPI003A13B963